MTHSISSQDITGVILAGGRANRMGGVDKGLQNFNGMSLALHTLMRLGPQVSDVMINANRNLSAYESFGASVWPDAQGNRTIRTQPVFCLLRCELLESLVKFTHSGGRKIDAWTAQHKTTVVNFDQPTDDLYAFANVNTVQELVNLEALPFA